MWGKGEVGGDELELEMTPREGGGWGGKDRRLQGNSSRGGSICARGGRWNPRGRKRDPEKSSGQFNRRGLGRR